MAHTAPVVVISRFKEAGAFARKQTEAAVAHALEEAEKSGNRAIERANTRRDYQLPADINREMIGGVTGFIEYPHDYGFYFEFGFRSVPPLPFMRPAGRKMKAIFKADMGDLYRGWRNTYIRLGDPRL